MKRKRHLALGLSLAFALTLLPGCSQGNAAGSDQIIIYSNADEEAVAAMENALDSNGYEGQYIFQTYGTSELGGLRQEMPVPVSTVLQIRMHIRTVTTATPHRIRTRQCTAVHTSSRTLPALPITIRQAVRPLPSETAAAATTAATLM